MKTIAATVLASTIGLTGLTAAPAFADTYQQVCVADPTDPALIHSPFVIEGEPGEEEYLAGKIVRPFPQNAQGCASYDGTPLQDWEVLYPGTPAPTTPTCEPTVQVVPEVQVVEVPSTALEGKVKRQRAKIQHLRSVIRHLRNR